MRLLVAIPCLNEAATLADVIGRVPREIEGIPVTIVVIDDGSTDDTAAIARANGAEIIEHGTNRGVGAAFHTAVEHALSHGFALMVNIDGDGQFDPADIPKLVQPVLAGKADLATASRFASPETLPDMPRVKLVGNRMMSLLISRLCGHRFHDVSCGFRAYSREALLRLNLHGAFTYTQETFLDLSYKKLRIVEVPIVVRYFANRQSRVAGNIPRYAARTALIIARVYRDYFPLRFFFTIAGGFFLLALIFGGVFTGHFLLTGKFTGYLFAGFLSAFFAMVGLVFSILAVVTDMLDRIRVNQERILYLLKKRLHRAAPP